MNKLSLTIHAPQELSQSSYVFTGLFQLQKLEGLHIKVKLLPSLDNGRLVFDKKLQAKLLKKHQPKTTVYTLVNKNTEKRTTFAIDLYDHANDFSLFALTHCDFYFKRSFESKYVDKLPADVKHKCHPLGLSFRVSSKDWKSNKYLRRGYMLNAMRLSFKFDRYLFSRLRKKLKAARKHLNAHDFNRDIALFENYNTEIDTQSILFQTRCFSDKDNSDAHDINEQRYRIIKLLRDNFPKQFNGGFVPSDIVNAKYADAITNVPTEPETYLKYMKQSGIVIYTRGLANSPAWKMAEYLSQAKVIIAEKLTTELPVPLVNNKHLLYFKSDQELVMQVQKVLNNKKMAQDLSQNARLYFENHVHPIQNMKRVLGIVSQRIN